jgi:hypothetical protein
MRNLTQQQEVRAIVWTFFNVAILAILGLVVTGGGEHWFDGLPLVVAGGAYHQAWRAWLRSEAQ